MHSTNLVVPYPGAAVIIDGTHCDGFPFTMTSSDLPGSVSPSVPYPLALMTVSAGYNSGFPAVRSAEFVNEVSFSQLCFGDVPIDELFFGSTEIKFAYCGGGTVFRKY
jgi:hypothetical protein